MAKEEKSRTKHVRIECFICTILLIDKKHSAKLKYESVGSLNFLKFDAKTVQIIIKTIAYFPMVKFCNLFNDCQTKSIALRRRVGF